MGFYFGFDIGGSMIKAAAVDDNMNMLAEGIFPSDISDDMLTEKTAAMLESARLSENELEFTAATGVGAGRLGSVFFSAPVKFLTEFECFGRGAQFLTDSDDILAVSMGTGTAFVHAKGSDYTHLGGSGVGGGTLMGLSALMTGTRDVSHISELICKGDWSAVDLTVGDLSTENVGTLSADVTAANFGKRNISEKPEDIAAGICNMIFQTAGIMAGLSCSGLGIKKAVFTGSFTDIPKGRDILKSVGQLYGLEFTSPEKAKFAGALGAVLRCMNR